MTNTEDGWNAGVSYPIAPWTRGCRRLGVVFVSLFSVIAMLATMWTFGNSGSKEMGMEQISLHLLWVIGGPWEIC